MLKQSNKGLLFLLNFDLYYEIPKTRLSLLEK
jgi:hypothetical protein